MSQDSIENPQPRTAYTSLRFCTSTPQVIAFTPSGTVPAAYPPAQARTASVPAQLSWEAYMRCGIGICGSCEHEGMLLCADGPVLCRG